MAPYMCRTGAVLQHCLYKYITWASLYIQHRRCTYYQHVGSEEEKCTEYSASTYFRHMVYGTSSAANAPGRDNHLQVPQASESQRLKYRLKPVRYMCAYYATELRCYPKTSHLGLAPKNGSQSFVQVKSQELPNHSSTHSLYKYEQSV